MDAGVTHRLEVRNENDTVLIEFHGLLDAAALVSLKGALARASERGAGARLLLRAGTEVDRSLVPQLQGLNVAVEVESPYLARWLAREP